jgi:hypothetical protein
MISVLKELVPTTEREIDRHYYYCYGEGSVQVEKTGDVVVYIVKGERFGDYIHSAYGKSVKVPAVRGDVHFNRVNIFGAPWTNKYGYPFVDTSLKGRDLAFGGDFNCLSPSAAYRSCGTVATVDAHQIHVTSHNGKGYVLSVGACSRI